MSNEQVTADWNATVDKLNARIGNLQNQRLAAEQKVTDLVIARAQLVSLAKQTDNPAAKQGLIANADALGKSITKQEQAVKNISAQEAKAERELQSANVELQKSINSPPGTRANPETTSTPAPANPEPGNNTDLPPVTFDEPIQAIIPQQVDADGVITAVDLEVPDAVADVGELGINTSLPTDLDTELYGSVQNARSSGNEGRITPFPQAYDYRVRISLADSADYLYKDPSLKQEDLLYPLAQTNGVIYPYTPTISVTYAANYQSTDLTHSNYRAYNYTGSNIDQFQITGDFTAQDVVEANYVLAVIHFFRSVTKMFYGQDQNRGVPPPLVYITGHGEYGFDKHPLAITNFTLSYPTDVDYINAGPSYNVANVLNPYKGPILSYSPPGLRLSSAKLNPGGLQSPPVFGLKTNTRNNVTRVPTKLQIQLSAIPIVTRNTISNIFSLKDYATGNLLRGSKNKSGGGVW